MELIKTFYEVDNTIWCLLFNIFRIITIYKRSTSKQRYCLMAGSVTEMSLNFMLCKRVNASSWARSQLHSWLVFKRLQPSSIYCDVNHRFDLRRPRLLHRTWRRWDIAVHRRWYRTLWAVWASTTLAVESPTDLVASHWLERSPSRFSVSRAFIVLHKY